MVSAHSPRPAQLRPGAGSLQIDVQVAQLVRLRGPSSHECRLFKDALREKATGTLRRLHDEGRLHVDVVRAGNYLLLPVPRTYVRHVSSLLSRTASSASEQFTMVEIIGGRWSATQGVSIADSFLLTCFYCFAQYHNEFCHDATIDPSHQWDH